MHRICASPVRGGVRAHAVRARHARQSWRARALALSLLRLHFYARPAHGPHHDVYASECFDEYFDDRDPFEPREPREPRTIWKPLRLSSSVPP